MTYLEWLELNHPKHREARGEGPLDRAGVGRAVAELRALGVPRTESLEADLWAAAGVPEVIAELARRIPGVTIIHQNADGTKTHVAGPPPPPGPKPMAEWSWVAKGYAGRRRPEDKGLGDTLARDIDRLGGRLYKWLYQRLMGKNCSACGDRQAKLNAAYPYPT